MKESGGRGMFCIFSSISESVLMEILCKILDFLFGNLLRSFIFFRSALNLIFDVFTRMVLFLLLIFD